MDRSYKIDTFIMEARQELSAIHNEHVRKVKENSGKDLSAAQYMEVINQLKNFQSKLKEKSQILRYQLHTNLDDIESSGDDILNIISPDPS